MKKVPKIPYTALRKLLKRVLDDSFSGCNADCLYCGGINNDVCEFVDKYIHKRKLPKCCASCINWGTRGECELTRKEAGGVKSVLFFTGRDTCKKWKRIKDLKKAYKEIITGALP
jgi:hypothetical protein